MQLMDKQAQDLKKKAEAHFTKGDLKRALDEFQKLKEMFPRDMRIVQKLGDILHKLGRLDEAKSHYKTAAAHFTKEGYWAKAVALNKIIISIDPQDKEVQKEISDIYTTKGLIGQKSGTVLKPRAPVIAETPREQEVLETSPSDVVEDGQPPEVAPNAVAAEGGGGWRIPLFSDLTPQAMSELLDKLSMRRVSKGGIICRQGDPGNSMFVISEGWVEIFIEQENSQKLMIDSLKEGDFFGEFGLLTDGIRHACAAAKSDVMLLEITAKTFSELASKYPTVPKILDNYFTTRMFLNVLRKSSLFDSLFTDERMEIVKKFSSMKVQKGQYIFREGDEGDRIFFIKSGDVEIAVTRKGDNVVISRLSGGDFFGEISLLIGTPRTASARSISETDLLYLDTVSFREVISQYPQIGQKLKAKMEERAKDTIEAYRSHEEMKKCLGMV